MPKTMNTTLEKIKQRAYWHVEIFPAEYTEGAIPFGTLKDVIGQAAVQYRGWDYPHIVTENIDDRQECYPMENSYYEAWIDWSMHKELWRAYKSAKFTHLFAVHEQWFDEYETPFMTNPYPDLEPKFIDVTNIVLKVTEIVEFLHNFANKVDGVDNFVFRVKIKNASGNELTVLDRSRVPLSMAYKNRSETIVGYDGQVSKQTLLAKDSRDLLGKDIAQAIYSHFDGWQWSDDAIAAERQKLLERRL
jgi:hypothetical protein